MKTQAEIFENVKMLGRRVANLSTYVQNDLGRMLEDGYIDNDRLTTSLRDAEDEFNHAIEDLVRCKTDVIETIKLHIR